MEVWTIKKLLDWTTDYFKKYAIEWPHLEAEILLAHSLGLKRIDLYVKHEKVLTPEELAKFKGLIQRRSLHEPIAYITGNQPFMSLDFKVNPSVLIPRPETEKLVEVAIDLIKSRDFIIADIGTGCGCIAITLAKYLPEIKVIGIDSSPEAIAIAKENARKHKVENRCEFVVGNMLEPLKNKPDLILSNPPYIPTADIEKLDPDVKDFEPHQALDGGADGLDYIRKLIEESPKHADNLILEFGINQAEAVKELAQGKFSEIKILEDTSGKERLFLGVK